MARFDHQVFLFDMIHEINQQVESGVIGPNPTTFYKDIPMQPSSFIKTIKNNSGDFFDLHGNDLATSPKKIEIYKIVKGPDGTSTEILLPFGTLFTDNTRQTIAGNRGLSGVKLNSFSWEDLGTNPADTGFSFKTTMVFETDNIGDIFKDQGGARFSDLFVPPGGVNARDNTSYQDFEIKVVCGYEKIIKHNKSKKMETDIRQEQETTLFLNLVSHNIDIDTKSSGRSRFLFTLNHIAALESRFFSSEGDLLNYKPADPAVQERIEKLMQQRRALMVQKNSNKDADAASKALEDLDKEIKALKKQGNRLQSIYNLKNLESIIGENAEDKIKTIILTRKQRESFYELQKIDRTPKLSKEELQVFDKPAKRLQRKADVEAQALANFIVLKRAIKEGGFDFKIYQSSPPKELASGETINFIFLGDIFRGIIEIFKSNLKDKKDFEKFDFNLGTVSVFNPDSKNFVEIPISRIPISIDMYNAWIKKTFVDNNVKKITFLNFVRSMCSSLIYSVLNRMKFSVVKRRIRMNYFVDYDKVNKLQVFFLYSSGYGHDGLTGNREKDHNVGVYHLNASDTRNIVKKINFSRTDLQSLREARIEESRDLASRSLLFSDFYKASVEIQGNNLFKPGQIVYIDCTLLGFPGPSGYLQSKLFTKKEASQSPLFAPLKMGLQGYYSVIKISNDINFVEQKYDTKLELLFLGVPYSFTEKIIKVDLDAAQKTIDATKSKVAEIEKKRAAEVREGLKAQGLDPKSQGIIKKRGFSRIQ